MLKETPRIQWITPIWDDIKAWMTFSRSGREREREREKRPEAKFLKLPHTRAAPGDSPLLWNWPLTLRIVLHITMCQRVLRDGTWEQHGWVWPSGDTLETSKPENPITQLYSSSADLYLCNPINLVSVCEGTSRLAQFYRLRSRRIGYGSDACRLLMINEFHHCHFGTMVAQTEAVCQPRHVHAATELA